MVKTNQLVCSPKNLQRRGSFKFPSKLRVRRSSSYSQKSQDVDRDEAKQQQQQQQQEDQVNQLRRNLGWRRSGHSADSTEGDEESSDADSVSSASLRSGAKSKASLGSPSSKVSRYRKFKRSMGKRSKSSLQPAEGPEQTDGNEISAQDGVQALTQASESIEDAEKREGERAEKRRSAESSKRRSLRDAFDDLLTNDQLPSERVFEETAADEGVAEDTNDGFPGQWRRPSNKRYLRRRSSCYTVFNVPEAIFLLENPALGRHVASFLSVREHVALAQVSRALLETVRDAPLRLDYSKRVMDMRVLEGVFSKRARLARATSWRVAGLYTEVSELETLFNVIEPADLEFIGLINPRVRSLKPLCACTSLLRFELHSCRTALDLEPLLTVAKTLQGLSLLACDQIEDISLVEHLPELRMLSVFKSARLKTLPDLHRCDRLEFLSAGECPEISSVQPIYRLDRLRVLDLSFVRSVNSLDFLAHASQLRVLILDRCTNLSNLAGLEEFGASLEVLRLNHIARLDSLRGLEHCPRLTSLEMTGLAAVQDLSPLGACEQLEDLLLLDCASVQSLEPLSSSSHSMRRLIVSGCHALRGEADAQVVEACSHLIVFKCTGCHPSLLMSLMNSTRPTVLAAAERELPALSQFEFEQVALPEILRRLVPHTSLAVETRAALRVIQACSANYIMLAAMVREGVVEWLVSALAPVAVADIEGEEDGTDDESSVREVDDEVVYLAPHDYLLEVLRALGALLKDTASASRVLGAAQAVENIAHLICVPAQAADRADEEICMDALISSGTSLDEEKCTAEAARVLARVLQHASAMQRSSLSERIIETEAPLAAVDMMSFAGAMDRTRRPLIVFLNTLLDPHCVDALLREELAHALLEMGLVDALISTSKGSSIETQMLTVALLASVSKAGAAGSALVGALCERSGSLEILVSLLNSAEDHEVLRSIVQVLLQTPASKVEDVARTPRLLAGLLACVNRELGFQEHVQFGPQSEASLMLVSLELLDVLSRHTRSAQVMIAEEAGPVFKSSSRASGAALASVALTSLPGCRLVKDLHVAVLNGPHATRVACARVLVNLARASKHCEVALVDLFRNSKALKDVFMLASRGASSATDPMAGLDLLLVLLNERGIADVGARFSTALAGEFTKGLLQLTTVPGVQQHLEVVAHALGLLLASGSQRMIYAGVIVPLVAKVQSHSVQVQTRISRALMRTRRRSSPSRIDFSAQSSSIERRAALRILVSLADQDGNQDVIRALSEARVLENLVASLADDDRSCRELAVRLLEAVMSSCVAPPGVLRQKRMVAAEKLLLQSMVHNPLLPRFAYLTTQALTDLLDTGAPRTRVATARLLAMVLTRDEDLHEMLLGGVYSTRSSSSSTGSLRDRAGSSGRGLSAAPADVECPQSGSDKDSDDEGLLSCEMSTDGGHDDGDGESFNQVDEVMAYGESLRGAPQPRSRRGSRVSECGRRLGAVIPPLLPPRRSSRWSSDFTLGGPEAGLLKLQAHGDSSRERQSIDRSEERGTLAGARERNWSVVSSDAKSARLSAPNATRADTNALFHALRRLLMEPSLSASLWASANGAREDLASEDSQRPRRNSVSSDLTGVSQAVAEEIAAGCDLVAALVKVDARRVKELVLQPIVSVLREQKKVSEQERAVEVLLGLSGKEDEPTFAALSDVEAFPLLAAFLCAHDVSEIARARSLRALAKSVHGRSDRLLALDERASLFETLFSDVCAEESSLFDCIVDLLGPVCKLDEPEFPALCSRLISAGLGRALQRWHTQVAVGGTSRLRSRAEIDIGRVLVVPALHGEVRVVDDGFEDDLADLVSNLLVADERFAMRVAYGQLLAALDVGFLDDRSDAFERTIARNEAYKLHSAREAAYDREQLKMYPLAFRRVRGYPVPFSHEDTFCIRVQQWTTLAMQQQSRHGRQASLSHRRVYYEIELMGEFAPDTVVGWVSDIFQDGVVLGFTAGGVGEDPESWGLRLGNLFKGKDVIGVAADLAARTLSFTRNGKSIGFSITLERDLRGIFPAVTTSGLHAFFNFGSRPFRFSAPSRGRAVFKSVFRSVMA